MPPVPVPRVDGFTTTTDVPLYWCIYGAASGEKLLLLHGGPGAHHDYLLPQMLSLAEPNGAASRELLFYDQRRGGRSRCDTSDREAAITWQTHVRDLELVIDELHVESLCFSPAKRRRDASGSRQRGLFSSIRLPSPAAFGTSSSGSLRDDRQVLRSKD